MLDFKKETFYTPEEVAQRFKLSLTTIYNLIKSNQIPALQLGKSFRIAESKLAELWTKKSPVIPKTAHHFVHLLQKAPFCDEIVDLILFGSQARGDSHLESDIDLLLLYTQLSNKELEKIVRMETDAMEASGYIDDLSVLKKSVVQWEILKKIGAGIYQNILQEGISLWKNHPKG